MPFDAMVAIGPRPSLSAELEERGITPVSLELLAAHKQAQAQKFGPSIWYKHQALLSVGLILTSPAIGVAAAATQSFTPHSNSIAIVFGFIWMCLIALVTGSGVIRLRAGSHWEERWVPASRLLDLGVPEEIATIARRLQRDLFGSTLTLGELKREEVVLDPYLLLDRGNECICLGIWEDDKIIARPRQRRVD